MDNSLDTAEVSVFFEVIDECGRYIRWRFGNLEILKEELEQLAADGQATSPIRRIVKVTREEIILPEFVREYNNKCRKAR